MRYEIHDPRNPLTKRRREASEQVMKDRKWTNGADLLLLLTSAICSVGRMKVIFVLPNSIN
jgi:hypothetical protein